MGANLTSPSSAHCFFVVRLDRRFRFRQRQLEADVRIQMAVGYMMDHLPQGPAPWAIGCV